MSRALLPSILAAQNLPSQSASHEVRIFWILRERPATCHADRLRAYFHQGTDPRLATRRPEGRRLRAGVRGNRVRGAEGPAGAAAAIDYARAGDTVVVWKLDRLARSMRQLIEAVGALQARGLGFRSLTESIDTTSPGGGLVFHLFGALAGFGRSIIRERSRAGLDAARARGRIGGRRPSFTDKDLSAARALLRDRSLTVEEVARRLGVAPATLYRHIPGGRSTIGGGYSHVAPSQPQLTTT